MTLALERVGDRVELVLVDDRAERGRHPRATRPARRASPSSARDASQRPAAAAGRRSIASMASSWLRRSGRGRTAPSRLRARDQLGEQPRIAAGQRGQAIEHRGRQVVGRKQQRRGELAHGVVAERFELVPLDPGGALAEARPDSIQGARIGGDQDPERRAGPAQRRVLERVEERVVGEVGVVDKHGERAGAGALAQRLAAVRTRSRPAGCRR